MAHRTSLYIRSELLEKIDLEARKQNITKQQLIITLLHSYAQKVKNNIKINKSIQYQKDGKNWKRVNIILEINEYEFFLDIRKFLKLSISHVLYLAIKRMIFEIKNGIVSKKALFDKNIYGILSDHFPHDFISWKIIWSFTENQILYHPKR